MTALPLIRNFAPGAVYAHCAGRPASEDDYLRDVLGLAALLPERPWLVNLCADRYQFSVAFGAALVRGQVNLLPPDQATHSLARIQNRYPGAYALTDGDDAGLPLEAMHYPRLAANGRGRARMPEIPAHQIAAILFTSGSTGEPVAHEKSWRSLAASTALDEASPFARFPGAVVVGTVPPQHMYGLEFTVLLPMQNGLSLHSGRPFYPADVCAALAGVPRPRILVTTPVHLRALLADDVPPVDFVLCATAPLASGLAAAAEAAFAAPLYEIYGCTEAGQIAMRRTAEGPAWRPLAGVAMRESAAGTRVTGRHISNEVLLGDIIEPLEGGRFLLHGRVADLVNIAGKRTSLGSLNYHLNAIEGVRDGVFVVPPDDGSGTVTRLAAFVVAPGMHRDALLRALHQRIDAAFIPRPLHFVAALPRNDSGKLARPALEALIGRAARETG